MDCITIGRRLHAARLMRGLTCEMLGDTVAAHKSTISRYECGYIGRPSVPLLYRMATALHVSFEWVMGLPGALPTSDTEECLFLSRWAAIECPVSLASARIYAPCLVNSMR